MSMSGGKNDTLCETNANFLPRALNQQFSFFNPTAITITILFYPTESERRKRRKKRSREKTTARDAHLRKNRRTKGTEERDEERDQQRQTGKSDIGTERRKDEERELMNDEISFDCR